MADLGRINQRTIRASDLTRAEFDDIKTTYRDTGLWCVECDGGMYPQLRHYWDGTRQLFCHQPGTLETCPARRDETATHHELKHAVAAIAETKLGLRALVDERKFAGLKPDVMLFDADKTQGAGPRAVYEIQHSGLDLATFDSRNKRLVGALNRLSDGTYDRRVAPWLFTYEPTYESTRDLIEVTQALDGSWQAYGGIWTSPERETFADLPLERAMADMHAGHIVRLEESEAGKRIAYWTQRPDTPKPERRAPRLRQTWQSPPCDRPPTRAKSRAFNPGGHPICTVCGNPIMWTAGRTTHVVCEATQ